MWNWISIWAVFPFCCYLNILSCFCKVYTSILVMNLGFGLISWRRFIAPAVRHSMFILKLTNFVSNAPLLFSKININNRTSYNTWYSLKVGTSWIHDYPSEASFISSSAYSLCFMLALRNKRWEKAGRNFVMLISVISSVQLSVRSD